MTGWANSFAWIEDREWRMLVEGSSTDSGAPWVIARAKSRDGERWQIQGDRPLESLRPPGYNQYSGPWLANNGRRDQHGRYRLWYHVTKAGTIHSDIWFAHSRDAIHWTPATTGQLYANDGRFEREQAADPSVLDAADTGLGRSLMFYDGVDNTDRVSYINVASFTGSLTDLIRAET